MALKGWWKLISNTNDSIKNEYNATSITSISYTTRRVGNAATFNGTDSRISIPPSYPTTWADPFSLYGT